MIKGITLTLSILICFSVYGQSILSLDEKYGFKKFKFGTSSKTYSDLVTEESFYSDNPYIKQYGYNGSDLKSLFNVEITSIHLTFYKDMLCVISLYFGNIKTHSEFTDEQYNILLYCFENSYGKKWFRPENEDGTIIKGAIWVGDKVKLDFYRIDSEKNSVNKSPFYVIGGMAQFSENNLYRKMLDSNL